jgi:hypothetical protein
MTVQEERTGRSLGAAADNTPMGIYRHQRLGAAEVATPLRHLADRF